MERKLQFIQKSSLLFLIIILISCTHRNDKAIILNKDIYLIKTFKTDSLAWGYDIYKNGKITIHQPNIPAIEGNITFKSKEDAYKTAELVVIKLKNNIFPPSLSKEEVENVIKN
ncbi:MAG: DUF4907 domain-containing protein [Bacteroidales bacterium]